MVDIAALQRENAKLLVEKIRDVGGVKLDFSIDSLKQLEHWVDGEKEHWPSYERYDFAVLCSAYLGEVIRKKYGGAWVVKIQEFQQPVLLRVGDANRSAELNVVGKALKFIENGSEDSLWNFVDSLQRYL